MTTDRLCAISVDLDEVPHYFAIHGLPLEGSDAHAAYDRALPRLGAFAEARGVPLTLFAVGADLERPESAEVIRVFSKRGHAIENHSLNHRYDLTRLSRDEIKREVAGGAGAIERVTGRRPKGFRAPGYTVSDALFDVLEEERVAFDSSVFPCPPYYLAKAAALAGMRLRGRTSRSVLDTPRVLTAPTKPYRPGSKWYRSGFRSFLELPIQVTRGLRLPFIGTSVELAGRRGAAWLARGCAGASLVNLELHAIDFLDVSEGVEKLRGHQPELARPLEDRLAALGSALDALKSAGYSFVRLDEAAAAQTSI